MGKLHSVQSVQWEEKDSPLDTPDNSGLRIFPDKQNPQDTIDRSKVKVKATIKPRESGIKVYFKSFDVDDPSSNTSPIDANGPDGDDNRGNVNNKKEGELSAPWALTDTNGIAEVELTVTMQPGDNFRIGSSCNETILKNMIELATDEVKATDMLTVWRRLHVELDSMATVENNNASGSIIGIDNNTDKVTIDSADLKMNGISATSLDDGSADKGPPPTGNGRFENGTLTIGANSFGVASNGDLFLNMTDNVTISFTIKDKNGQNENTGNVTELRKIGPFSQFIIDIILPPGVRYEGGTITIGGVDFKIILAGGKTVGVSGEVKIPFELKDDDDDTLLPKFPHIGLLDNALVPAYVRPVFDVGDLNLNVPFVLNVDDSNPAVVAVQDWDSMSLNEDKFWVAYVLESFQGDVSIDDRDPDTEGPAFGYTANPQGGSLIFLEIHKTHEGVANPAVEEQDTVVHEVGHAVGGSGDDEEPGVTDGVGNYTAKYLNYIRSSPHPWP